MKEKDKLKLKMLVRMLITYLAVLAGTYLGIYLIEDTFSWELTTEDNLRAVTIFLMIELIGIKENLIDKE